MTGSLDGVRTLLRQLGWAVAIGLVATLGWSWLAFAWQEALTQLVVRIAASPEGRAATAVVLLGLLQALAALVAALLAGLAADLPLPTAALGGALTVLLPAAVMAAVAGLDEVIGLAGLVRLAMAGLAAAASTLGVRGSRRLLRRAKPSPTDR